jgi:type IV pilus assembly protein PilO
MRNRSWVNYAALAVVLAGLFFFAYYKPKMSVLSTLRTERTTIEKDVSRLRSKKKQMDKVEAELATLTDSLKELEAIIPQHKEISDILSQFQQLAYDTRLNITKFTPKGEIFKEFYSEWPLPLELTGNYHNLGLFFDRLSRFSRLFTIERFSVKSLAKQTEAASISAGFTAKTYLFLDEERIKAIQEQARLKGKKSPIPTKQPAAPQTKGPKNKIDVKDRP